MDDLDMETNYPIGGEDMDDSSFAPHAVGEERDVTKAKDGGVMKKLLVEGEGYQLPEKGDEVTVHYHGTLLSGEVFDSSKERNEPFKFTLGTGNVIKGWDVGVATMRKGEKSLLTCTAAYAYGDTGAGAKIPPGATLCFEVELLSWRSIKDLAGDGGVIKTVLAEGTGWDKAKEADGVQLSYVAKQGEAVVASAEGVTLGSVAEAPCPGLRLALATMKKGECVSLALSPAYALGLGGAADAALEVEVTLMEIQKVEAVEGAPGVTKKMLVAGEGYERPNELAQVQLRVSAALQGGAQVLAPTAMACCADDGAFCPGLDKAVLCMHRGETAEVTVPAAAAFGATGYTPSGLPAAEGPAASLAFTPLAAVPGGATLVFTVSLVSFTKEKESWDLPGAADKLAFCEAKKAEGNALFSAGAAARAVKRYAKALKIVETEPGNSSDEQKRSIKALKATLQSNSAAAHLKTLDYASAAKAAAKALELEPGNGKARFRAALAAAGLGELVEAEAHLKRLLEAEPEHKEAERELARVRLAQKKQNAKDAALYGKMFAPAKVAAAPVAAVAAQ